MAAVQEQGSSKREILQIQGIATWTHPYKPSDPYTDKKTGSTYAGRYSVDLIITDEQAKKFEKRGITVRTVKEHSAIPAELVGKPCVKISRAEFTQKGNRNIISVVDAKKKPMKALIGIGSKVNVAFSFYEYKNGVSLWLHAIQVLDLVPYTGGNDGVSVFAECDGYEDSGEHDPVSATTNEDEFDDVF